MFKNILKTSCCKSNSFITKLSYYCCIFFAYIPLSSATSQLELTEQEQQWLATHPEVVFTGDPNWLPYEAFDENGQYIGIVSEHLKLIEKATGLTFKMSPSKTWTESTEKAKAGKVDILSETDDSDLKTHLNFTSNYLSNPIVIAMHNRENYVENINQIKDRKIALIKDYGYASKIRRKYTNIKFSTVDDIQHGLVAVSTGEVDALLCTLALCSYTIAELGLNNVRIIGKTEFDTKLALGVKKNLPELVSVLNKAIASITPGEQQVILDAWIKQKFVQRTDYTLTYQVLIISSVLLAIFIFWNRRLSREISLRVATEEELKGAEETLRLSHQRILLHREQTPLAVIEWNTDFEVVYWNKAAERIFGFSKQDALGKHPTNIILPESARDAVDSVWKKLLNKKGGERSTNENITKRGETILCEWYNTPLVDPDGKVIGVTSLVDDITERKMSEEMIWRQANFDTLTGLPNRNMFHDRLKQEMVKADRDNSSAALLLIDLDQFKEVNDTLGHDVGDQLLREAGDRITSCVRQTDTVARLGGDEFTVILHEVHVSRNIDDIAQNIINQLEEEYQIGDEHIHISASIGITLYPDDAKGIDALLKNADQAMYAAKKSGRHCFSYFTQSLQDAAQYRMRLSHDLRGALENDQFEVYFQPIIDLNSNKIIKAEALLRWNHPKRGMVSPEEFIPLAEEKGFIYLIGNWVLRESIKQAKKWRAQYNSDFQVSINVSPLQFKFDTEQFKTEWQECINELDVDNNSVVVEITEGLLLDAEEGVIEKLLWLRDSGIQVAIDDFGTGYSSLSYIREFHIDYLKIDKVFVNNLEDCENDVKLCNAIVAMAHTLDLKVIAEGVETEKQKELLIESGCDYVQGFLFSEAVPADEFDTLLSTDEHQSIHTG